jgi:two-component system, LytTR family, sensor kinase
MLEKVYFQKLSSEKSYEGRKIDIIHISDFSRLKSFPHLPEVIFCRFGVIFTLFWIIFRQQKKCFMFDIIYSKKYRLSLHLAFWIFYIFFFTLQSFLYYNDISYFPNLLSRWVLSSPVVIAATYFNIYYLIPHVLLKKRYLKFFILSIFSATAFLVLNRAINFYIIAPLLYEPSSVSIMYRTGLLAVGPILSAISNIYVIVAIAACIKLFKQWYIDQQKHKELVKEKLEAELSFLKSQIHPHFLFNLLNNLYSLTLKKSDKAPEVILKLSSLLDYMLYQSGTRYVSVEKEITLLKDYIELEKLRYGDRLKINLAIDGDYSGSYIAPMILFPFVENAFKHGAANQPGDAWIAIKLSINTDKLIFTIENQNNSKSVSDKQGIGLKNVKRQLELLYENRFELQVEDNSNTYVTKLILQLNNNKT